jgi:hypothetical protein
VRQTTVVATSILLIVAGAVLAVFLWLRTYAPLRAMRPFAPGSGLGADVEPTFGSGGKTVLVPAAGATSFRATITLHNAGRFAVTLTGIEAATGALGVAALDDPVHQGRFRGLRLDPHDSASIVVEWKLDCSAHSAQVASDRVRLRYRYLSMFTRTAAVELPFAVTLRCSGGPPASP